ncbi:MAG: DoxX family protein [Verrucomicrobiota bacterium]
MDANQLNSFANSGYRRLVVAGDVMKSPLLLAIRLYWGWQFFQTGLGKLGNLGKTSAFFNELRIPFPAINATLAGTVECVGGIFLILGLASRLTALPLIITMIVAYLTADLDAVKNVFSDSDSFVTAAPFLFLLAAVIVFAFGPGKFSIDHFLARKFRRI